MQDFPKTAVKYYKDGYNCAQSLLLAYKLKSGLDLNQLVIAAESFGVGIARMGETCGAVVGALMIIGLNHGRREVQDSWATEITYDLVEQFMTKFTALNGSTLCRELLGYDIGTEDGMATAEENTAFASCHKYVHDAAKFIAECVARPQEIGGSGKN